MKIYIWLYLTRDAAVQLGREVRVLSSVVVEHVPPLGLEPLSLLHLVERLPSQAIDQSIYGNLLCFRGIVIV